MGFERRQFNANADDRVIDDFGREWQQYDQSQVAEGELQRMFDAYFSIFPWSVLEDSAVGFDAGCGTGRWARLVAPRVGHLHLVDPSSAIEVARRNLRSLQNCSFHQATVDDLPFEDESMDFGYSLGVLHHVPDTSQGLASCTRKLKRGAPFLLYLYYAFDNRPAWFRLLWRATDIARRATSRLPFRLKVVVTRLTGVAVYWPLARAARVAEAAGKDVSAWPLSEYRDKSLYTMQTDALDRFGTRLEQRFTQNQIASMMRAANLDDIQFSPRAPFWCATGIKR